MEVIQVRKAKEKDIPEITALLKPDSSNSYSEKESEKFSNTIKRYLSEKERDILVVENQSQIIGFASILILQRLNQKNSEMYIPEIIIDEKFQHQGIGEKLINECVKIAKEKKCHSIRLESGNRRKEAHNLYKKLGFKQQSLSFNRTIKLSNKFKEM